MSFIGDITNKVTDFLAANFRIYAGKTDTEDNYYIDMAEYTQYLLSNGNYTISTGNAFSTALDFSHGQKWYNTYTQSGTITFTLNSNTFGTGATQYILIDTDGSAINFPVGWIPLKNELASGTGIYLLVIWYDGYDYCYMIISKDLDTDASALFDNTLTKSFSFTPDVNLNFGDGSTTDGACTYFCRFKINSNLTINPLLGRWVLSSASNIGFEMMMNNLKPRFNFYDNNNSNIIWQLADNDLSLDTWYSMAVTYDGSSANSGIKIYINGSLIASTGGSLGSYVAMHNSNDFYIGSFRAASFTYPTDALIADVMVINKELNATEVTELDALDANDYSTLSFAANVKLYLKLDGNIIPEVGSYTITNNGGVTFSTDGPY